MSVNTPPKKVAAAFVRMDAGGHTCIVVETDTFRVVRVKSGPLLVEKLSLQQLNLQYPITPYESYDSSAMRRTVKGFVEQYSYHAAHAGCTREALDLLQTLAAINTIVLAQIETRVAP